jgi:hypothetical protein
MKIHTIKKFNTRLNTYTLDSINETISVYTSTFEVEENNDFEKMYEFKIDETQQDLTNFICVIKKIEKNIFDIFVYIDCNERISEAIQDINKIEAMMNSYSI